MSRPSATPRWIISKSTYRPVILLERIGSRTEADVDRHARARIAFVMAFFQDDPRVHRLFVRLFRETDLGRQQDSTATEFERRFRDRMGHILSATARLVRALRLPSWVAWELLAAFYRVAYRRNLGTAVGYGLRLESARERRRPGRRPQRKQERLAENARWFYRARVKRPQDSVRGLAREYHEQNGHRRPFTDCGDGDRRTVRQGIAQAERALRLGTTRVPRPKSR